MVIFVMDELTSRSVVADMVLMKWLTFSWFVMNIWGVFWQKFFLAMGELTFLPIGTALFLAPLTTHFRLVTSIRFLLVVKSLSFLHRCGKQKTLNLHGIIIFIRCANIIRQELLPVFVAFSHILLLFWGAMQPPSLILSPFTIHFEVNWNLVNFLLVQI